MPLAWCCPKLQILGWLRVPHPQEWGREHTFSTCFLYANNTSTIIEAKHCYVDNLFDIFWTLGDAFSLFVEEVGVKAVFLGNGSPPRDHRHWLVFGNRMLTPWSYLVSLWEGRSLPISLPNNWALHLKPAFKRIASTLTCEKSKFMWPINLSLVQPGICFRSRWEIGRNRRILTNR